MIFTFGSNLAGIHGAGAAKIARLNYGAKTGVGEGLTGRAYALPTQATPYVHFISPEQVKPYVDNFLNVARLQSDQAFQVTQVGCGLAGFTKEQIAPLFQDAPKNCLFDTAWRELMPEGTEFWGTY
jgi:hypothetical protein